MKFPITCILAMLAIATAGAMTISLQNGVLPNPDYVAQGRSIRNDTESMFVGGNGGGASLRGILKFDLSPIPRNARVRSVTLRLRIARPDGSSDNVDVPITVHQTVPAEWDQASSAPSDPNFSMIRALSVLSANPATVTEVAAIPVHLFSSTPAFVRAVQKSLDAGEPLTLLVSSVAAEQSARAVFVYHTATSGETDAQRANWRPLLVIDYE